MIILQQIEGIRYCLIVDGAAHEFMIDLKDGVFETDSIDFEEKLLAYSKEDFPDNLLLRTGFPPPSDRLFNNVDFYKRNGQFSIQLGLYQELEIWTKDWSPNVYLQRLRQYIIAEERFQIVEEYTQDQVYMIQVDYSSETMLIGDIYQEACGILKEVINKTELDLNGFAWKEQYLTDEALFSKEVIQPLLSKLGFFFVRYNHGKKEYGKDFVFSEIDRFGQVRNYGMQVKAGNISGKVNSAIDEILGQIEDAFSMPYYDIGSKNPKYISSFVVAISGFFAENAKEKIAEKLSKGLYGTVYFFDQQSILEMVRKEWK